MTSTSLVLKGKRRATNRSAFARGMTLMEVVIAIGVVAFVIPLILAATGSAGNSRRNAEADTRSAWLARNIQQELILSWGENPSQSIFETSQDFPDLATAEAPEILLYDADGEFLQKGSSQDFDKPSKVAGATYVVALSADEYRPPGLATTANPLALVRLRVLHPAKSAPGKRSTYRYGFITSRHGTL